MKAERSAPVEVDSEGSKSSGGRGGTLRETMQDPGLSPALLGKLSIQPTCSAAGDKSYNEID